MTKFMTQIVFAAGLLAIAAPSVTLAQNNDRPQRGPDMASIASDLGVAEAGIETCLPRPGRPAEGEAPARPDLSEVASCLQGQGSSLTTDQITTILENNRPEHPPRQG